MNNHCDAVAELRKFLARCRILGGNVSGEQRVAELEKEANRG